MTRNSVFAFILFLCGQGLFNTSFIPGSAMHVPFLFAEETADTQWAGNGKMLSGNAVTVLLSDNAGITAEPLNTSLNTDFLTELETLCREAQQEYTSDIERQLNQCRHALIEEMDRLVQDNAPGSVSDEETEITDAELRRFKQELDRQNWNNGHLEAMKKRLAQVGPIKEKFRYATLLRNISSLLTIQQTASGDDMALFREACETLPQQTDELCRTRDPQLANEIFFQLETLHYCCPEMDSVKKIIDMVSRQFDADNFQLGAQDTLLSALLLREIQQSFKVNEMIRGSHITGTGSFSGLLSLGLIPDENNVVFQLNLNANVKTQTVSYRQGVKVYSSNTGTILATKPIYFSSQLKTRPATAQGNMKSTITAINSERLVGNMVVNKKVAQEKPYSVYESTRKLESRVSGQLESEVNQKLTRVNNLLRDYFTEPLEKYGCLPENITARTTDSQISWSARFATDNQLGGSPLDTKVLEGLSRHHLYLRVHQSCPNNLALSMIAGKRLAMDEMKNVMKTLLSDRPGLNTESELPETESSGMPSTVSDTDTAVPQCIDEPSNLWLTFNHDFPLLVSFDDNEIKLSFWLDDIEKEGSFYPELRMEFTYRIDPDTFTLHKENIDVFPANLDKDARIPARYQVIRTMVIEQLEHVLPDQCTISAKAINKENPVGTLQPKQLCANQGWLLLGFDFVPQN